MARKLKCVCGYFKTARLVRKRSTRTTRKVKGRKCKYGRLKNPVGNRVCKKRKGGRRRRRR